MNVEHVVISILSKETTAINNFYASREKKKVLLIGINAYKELEFSILIFYGA